MKHFAIFLNLLWILLNVTICGLNARHKNLFQEKNILGGIQETFSNFLAKTDMLDALNSVLMDQCKKKTEGPQIMKQFVWSTVNITKFSASSGKKYKNNDGFTDLKP